MKLKTKNYETPATPDVLSHRDFKAFRRLNFDCDPPHSAAKAVQKAHERIEQLHAEANEILAIQIKLDAAIHKAANQSCPPDKPSESAGPKAPGKT